MKQLVNLALVLLLSTAAFAKSDGVTKPQFPGGDKALVDFLNKTIVYPEEALKQKQEGKTLVAFTINEDGSIANVRVLKSSWHLLDLEAVRIVKMMPKWTPAIDNGVNKKEMVVLPISFDLSRKDIIYK
jgi:TonB family protein